MWGTRQDNGLSYTSTNCVYIRITVAYSTNAISIYPSDTNADASWVNAWIDSYSKPKPESEPIVLLTKTQKAVDRKLRFREFVRFVGRHFGEHSKPSLARVVPVKLRAWRTRALMQ